VKLNAKLYIRLIFTSVRKKLLLSLVGSSIDCMVTRYDSSFGSFEIQGGDDVSEGRGESGELDMLRLVVVSKDLLRAISIIFFIFTANSSSSYCLFRLWISKNFCFYYLSNSAFN
jgi:hypothetical protein